MSFNGSGTFSLASGNPVVTGTTISSTWANNTLSDIATGLSTVICKDGQTTVTANIPITGFKVTGLAAATATGDALSYGRAASITALTVTSTADLTGATATAATQSLGDNSTKVATTAFVAGTAFSSALPAQTGNSGKFVTTNGTTASWANSYPDATGHSGAFYTNNGTTASWSTFALAGTSSTTITFQGTDTYVGRTTTDTLTNKRITKRVSALSAGSATPAINTDTTDVVHITAQSAAITSFTTNLTGTPVDGDTLRISITDNGTARALTWGASFESSQNVTLPNTTVVSTRLDVGFVWNTETTKWRCVGVA